MARIVAVCRSKRKGTKKEDIGEGLLKINYGLVGDAHGDCNSHRQISLLAIESINKLCDPGLKVGPGDFAENLTTKGLDVTSLKIGGRMKVGEEVLLEITQLGKECRSPCAIYRKLGKCIMPEEGIFTRVLRGGVVRVGDRIKIEEVRKNARGG